MKLKIIEIYVRDWNKILEFYGGILERIGAPPQHGKNIDALIDSMIWGGINRVEAPYILRLRNCVQLPSDVADEIAMTKRAIEAARAEVRDRTGRDVDVTIELM